MTHTNPEEFFAKNEDNILRYGSLVVINFQQESLARNSQQFIHSDGFLNSRLTVKRLRDQSQQDVSGAVFRMLPPLKFNNQQALLKSLAGLKKGQ